jgi:hypothetical protein
MPTVHFCLSACKINMLRAGRTPYEEFCILGITPCNPLKVNGRFGGSYRLHLQGRGISQTSNLLATCFTLVSCFTYSSTLKMDAARSSETSVNFERTTWRYIPDDRTPTFWAPIINIFRCKQIYSENNFIIIFWIFWGKGGINLNAFL